MKYFMKQLKVGGGEDFVCRYAYDVQRSVEDEWVMDLLSEQTREVNGQYMVRCFGSIETSNFPTIVLWLFIDLVSPDPEVGRAYKLMKLIMQT